MKKLIFGLWLTLSVVSLKAQDEATFTDEDLTKYATVMVWADQEKSKMADSVEFWVKSNDKITGTSYNVLSKAKKKGALEEAEATEEEKTEFNIIQENIEGQKAAFKEVYVGKIKSDIGAGLYNRLKKSLKSDEEVKGRYEIIYQELLKPEVGGDASETSDSE